MTRPARPEGGKSMQPERPPRIAARPPRRRVPSVGALGRWVQANTFTPPWLPARWRHPSMGYLVAVLLQGVAGAVVVLLAQVLVGFAFPSLLATLAVALIALTWGAGPSLLGTLTGATVLAALLLSPLLHIHEKAVGRGVALGLYVAVGVTLTALASQSVRARRDAQDRGRRAAEEAARLTATIEALTDGVVVFDRDARVLRANAALRALLALDAHPDAADRFIHERGSLLAPLDLEGRPLPPEQGPIRRVLRGDTLTGPDAMDLRVRTLDGRERAVSVSGAPVYGSAGERIGGVLDVRDVTARRALERQLHDTAREAAARAGQLEAVLDAIGDGVYVYDTAGRILRANATGRALLPTDADPDYLARPVADRLPVFAARDARGHPLPPARWPLTRLLRGETLTDAEAVAMTVRAPSGAEREVTMAGAPILDREGRRIGVVAITRDVTERRRLDRRTGAALRALLAMADAVVRGAAADEGNPAGDDTAGGEDTTAGAVGRLAELTRRVLDCRRVGLIALREGRLEPLALAGDTPDAARVWRAGIAAFAPHADPASERADRLRAGEVIVVDLTWAPVRERARDEAATMLIAPLRVDGALVGVLHLDYGPAAHTYTTEERALALGAAQLAALVLERERLGAARAEATWLAARDRARAAFVATVSHELRTPLTSIQAGLGFLERAVGGRLGPDERALLDAIRRNAARLRRQIDDLLIANRLDAGALHPDRRPLDLAAVARTALDEVRPLLDEQGQDVTLDLPTPLPVAGDARLLGQVVVNLLVNVYRHTPSGTRVTLTGRVAGAGGAGDEVRLCVGDDGPGLPPDELEAIFGRFHRADAAAGGSGLGLAIAREIVALHGGRLWAANAAGGGAAFHLALPRDAGAAAGTVERAEKQGGQP